MPRELFGDVTKPSIKIGSRKWYTVPVSMGTHGLIVLALIVLPMLAPGLLPMPDATTVFTVAPPTPPSPPPPARRAETPPPLQANPNAAPTEAPDSITQEVDPPLFDPAIASDPTSTVAGTFDVRPPEAPPVSAPMAASRMRRC